MTHGDELEVEESESDSEGTKLIVSDSPEKTTIIESAISPLEKFAFGDFWLCVIEQCIHQMFEEVRVISDSDDLCVRIAGRFEKYFELNSGQSLEGLLTILEHNIWTCREEELRDVLYAVLDLITFLYGIGEYEKKSIFIKWFLDGHFDKMSQFQHVLVNGRGAEFLKETAQSRWDDSEDGDKPEAAMKNEWNSIQAIFDRIRDIGDDSLETIIVPALCRVDVYNHNAAMNDALKIVSRNEKFKVLFFHPIAVQFWSSLISTRRDVQGVFQFYRDDKQCDFGDSVNLFLEIFNTEDDVRAMNGGDLNPMHVSPENYRRLPEEYRVWYSIFKTLPDTLPAENGRTHR